MRGTAGRRPTRCEGKPAARSIVGGGVMERLVECVPNFSEGRERATVEALAAALRSVEGVVLLDQEMDADHHRAVLTFVGPPEAVAEAAFRATREAAERIDLRRHRGGHPRVGATDVVPFVPIRGVTMGDCVALARAVGERIGRELRIPVFLYERAASRSERTNLEAIRKGGLEGLAQRMAEEAAWRPDFGPGAPHETAGVTVVGARPPLIAYNVNLASTDLEAAKAIAKTVRASGGGLPCVKAIGVALPSRGLVQVSMNLTDYEVTPPHVAFDAVVGEAERRGLAVVGSEIVGLVPRRALLVAAERALKLEGFDPSQVLEERLEAALAEHAGSAGGWAASPAPFLDALAAGTPSPGGGSASALAGAMAAALGLMACRIGPPSSGPVSEETARELTQAAQRLAAVGAELRRLVRADAEAYEGVIQGYRLPKEDQTRAEVIADRLRAATEVPLRTATLALEAAGLIRGIGDKVRPSVAPDLKVGLLLALASAAGALENVAENSKSMKNQEVARSFAEKAKRLNESLVSLRGLC